MMERINCPRCLGTGHLLPDSAGNHLRVRRLARGIRQGTFARKLGVGQAYWCCIEKGLRPLTWALYKQAEALLQASG